MKAEIKPIFNENRVRLADVLPLSTPFTLHIAATQLCNFKCYYCAKSLGNECLKEKGYEPVNLDYNVFLKIMDQLSEFPQKLKQIQFTGLGEPFVNKDMPKMIHEITKRNVTEMVGIYTNGTLLTREMTDALKGSGLSQIILSVQGLSSKKYKEVTGTEIDFEKFVNNIEYFYKNRENCRLYIKIIDAELEDGEKEKFYKIFGDMCDRIYIEHLIRSQPIMNDKCKTVDSRLTLYGEKTIVRNVCPVLFYGMQIDSTGRVFPCLQLTLPKEFCIGDVNKQTLIEIWHSDKLRHFRQLHLKGLRFSYPICADCDGASCLTQPSDNLDDDATTLLKKFGGDN